ncbi:MAG TPA: hypothetical protein VK665_05065 [Candidatus Elarobacter sp.]|nr:hypothetical protein [Candidatus Elarobacter sp.]
MERTDRLDAERAGEILMVRVRQDEPGEDEEEPDAGVPEREPLGDRLERRSVICEHHQRRCETQRRQRLQNVPSIRAHNPPPFRLPRHVPYHDARTVIRVTHSAAQVARACRTIDVWRMK